MTQANVLAQIGSTSGPTFRNRIINGAMVIDQRNAGASVSTTAGGFNYTLDRWNYYAGQASKFTVQQNAGSVTPPIGFSNYLGVTSLSAYSVAAGDIFIIDQCIEGFNTADLGFGTANAKTITLSFQVYSSLTGTFGGSLMNSAFNRSYPFTYSVPVANTWTTISVTIAGDTSGTWIGATNGIGIRLSFGLGVGSTYSGTAGSWSANQYYSATGATSVVGTSGATFYITGVQLEVGSSATGYEYRQYGQELALCQRYCYVLRSTGTLCQIGVMTAQATTNGFLSTYLPTTPRVYPTGITASSATCLNTYIANSNVTTTAIAIASGWQTTGNYAEIYLTVASGLTVGQAGPVYFNTGTATIEFTGMEL